MNEHVELTVRDVNARIEQLQGLRTGLLALFAGDVSGPAVAEVLGAGGRVNIAVVEGPANTKNQTPKTNKKRPAAAAAPSSAAVEETLAKGRALPEQFHRSQLDVRESVRNGTLHRWKVRGWIEPVQGRQGMYRRTARFPKAGGGAHHHQLTHHQPEARRSATSTTPVRVPGLDADTGGLREQLEQALKERDSAVANGRETLAKILQDKVDKLQAQLGE